ncbi:DGQHR domain-containing protein [Sinorhizobium psoraleae]|uniref:DGQHR domain-containing protein n=1 Tax=Sinorhizobium psoraleae TaxID=520838 RepID=A0ABT4KA93_9HYPH|nr:DGQHR domain-containing protein [Sinorhizobium psoraleae]MCZ4088754.1 DGQHR domain-containing protein [Sinorhizobium psoraleae]
MQKGCVLVRFFDRRIPDPERRVRHIEHARKNGWRHDKEIRLYELNTVEYAMPFISASLGIVRPPHVSNSSFPVRNLSKSEVSMSTTITIPAARVRQGDLTLYATALKVRDLIRPGFYTVETLDPTDTDDKGYQRLLNKSRARKLADYVVKGQDARDAFLPTSVFLATDKTVPFDEIGNTITIDVAKVGPFNVVDGQHRLEGLKVASEKDSRVLDFEVPVNVAINLPTLHQMCHFLIVNSTQKSVDKSVEQRIVARLTEALDVEDIPSLPRWILNTVEKGRLREL